MIVVRDFMGSFRSLVPIYLMVHCALRPRCEMCNVLEQSASFRLLNVKLIHTPLGQHTEGNVRPNFIRLNNI